MMKTLYLILGVTNVVFGILALLFERSGTPLIIFLILFVACLILARFEEVEEKIDRISCMRGEIK
jgi:uncharacterized membrane protein YbaN (DUF454 family)